MNTPKPKPVKGVACPRCDGPMRTRKTVHRADRSTQRYRVCLDPKCGCTGTSFERLAVPIGARSAPAGRI